MTTHETRRKMQRTVNQMSALPSMSTFKMEMKNVKTSINSRFGADRTFQAEMTSRLILRLKLRLGCNDKYENLSPPTCRSPLRLSCIPCIMHIYHFSFQRLEWDNRLLVFWYDRFDTRFPS